MVKDAQTVIEEFNELVNIDATELKQWLAGDDSTSSGWSKSDGSGETIGHERSEYVLFAPPPPTLSSIGC
jgi:hypothetical protein